MSGEIEILMMSDIALFGHLTCHVLGREFSLSKCFCFLCFLVPFCLGSSWQEFGEWTFWNRSNSFRKIMQIITLYGQNWEKTLLLSNCLKHNNTLMHSIAARMLLLLETAKWEILCLTVRQLLQGRQQKKVMISYKNTLTDIFSFGFTTWWLSK